MRTLPPQEHGYGWVQKAQIRAHSMTGQVVLGGAAGVPIHVLGELLRLLALYLPCMRGSGNQCSTFDASGGWCRFLKCAIFC